MAGTEITDREFESLEHHVLIAFAARCVRRMAPLVPPPANAPQVEASMRGLEEIAAGVGPYYRYQSPLVAPVLAEAVFRLGSIEQRAAEVISEVMSAVRELITGLHMPGGGGPAMARANGGEWSLRKAVRKATSLLAEREASLQIEIRQDFSELLEYSRNSSTRGEFGSIYIPLDFFATVVTFDITRVIHEKCSVLEISSSVNAKLIEYFRQHPKRLFDLSPRQFEELIAELWTKFGWDVELTAKCRDGGRDVVAIKYKPSAVRFLIECKRWKRNVGVQVVRSLHGVLNDEQANKGIIATTARFSRDAKEHLNRHTWRLEGRDFDGLIEWLEVYHKIAMTGRADRAWEVAG